jgi:predicted nucleic acid-binding protein
VTIRKANDCLIAAICIENNYTLIHNDNDFNNIAKHTSLKIYK